jgi:hypothetical protein
MSNYLTMMLLPVVSVLVVIIAIKKDFQKPVFFVSVGVTMVIDMFLMKYLSLTMYGFICILTVPLAVIYVLICLFLSIK